MEDKIDDLKKSSENEKKAKSKKEKKGGKFALFLYMCFSVFLMFAVAAGVFFATVRGEEQVMVPQVEGKDIMEALLLMQEKELYPKIQLRYTENPDDAGKILSQSPDAGAIVKAGRRINLTVSRGVVIDKIENYVGESFDDVRLKLQSMFAGSTHPLIVLAEPSYKADNAPAGTIIAQDPPEGTDVSSPISVKLIVSRGAEFETTKVPNLVGLSIDKILAQMSVSKVVFDFSSHNAKDEEKPLTATYQQDLNAQYVRIYTRIAVDIAIAQNDENKIAGIFSAKLSKYPYPLNMSLFAEKDGKRTAILSFKHTGGNVTVPYNVEHDTTLILTVEGKEMAREFID